MTDLEIARTIFERDAPTFLLVRHGQELARGNAQGIRELLAALFALGAQARGASLADKVTGKAVAMAAAHAGVVAIYTPLAGERALPVCQAHGIALHAAQVIPLILNARGDGPCPLERTVGPIDGTTEGVRALAEFVHLPMP
jgi:hypothetical protein